MDYGVIFTHGLVTERRIMYVTEAIVLILFFIAIVSTLLASNFLLWMFTSFIDVGAIVRKHTQRRRNRDKTTSL